MQFIDIGANLAHESFAADLDALLDRARKAAVTQIVVTGSCRNSNIAAGALAERHPGRLFATAGVHPHHAEDWDADDAELIRALAARPGNVSLGECGLDYFRNLAAHEAQLRAFTAQLQLAAELGKPVFLHQRDAHSAFLPILREYRRHLPAVCVHCFTDTQAALEDYLALDCMIGITGWVCDKRRGADLRAVIPHLPMAALMIETDSPYLRPHNAPKADGAGRRNEPCNLPFVASALAEIYATNIETIARITSSNARRFFALPEPPLGELPADA